jgi:hypothetical protein
VEPTRSYQVTDRGTQQFVETVGRFNEHRAIMRIFGSLQEARQGEKVTDFDAAKR